MGDIFGGALFWRGSLLYSTTYDKTVELVCGENIWTVFSGINMVIMCSIHPHCLAEVEPVFEEYNTPGIHYYNLQAHKVVDCVLHFTPQEVSITITFY